MTGSASQHRSSGLRTEEALPNTRCSTGKQDLPLPALLPPQAPHPLNTNVSGCSLQRLLPASFPRLARHLVTLCRQMAFTRCVTNSSNSSIPVALGGKKGAIRASCCLKERNLARSAQPSSHMLRPSRPRPTARTPSPRESRPKAACKDFFPV